MKVTMMRQLGSPERTKILNLHAKRTSAAQAVRNEYALLLKASEQTKKYYCQEYPQECNFVASLLENIDLDIPSVHETQEFSTPL